MVDRKTAVGFRAHLGWADAVTLARSRVSDGIEVVDRRRIELRGDDGSGFPYHAARDVLPEDREAVIAAGQEAAEEAATDALADLAADLDFAAVGVVVSRGVGRIPLEKVLASSRLFHMAEGAVYQRALRGAAANLALPCVTVGFAEAEGHELWPTVSALGKSVGAPWHKDHKFAALAAWLAAMRDTTPVR